MFYTVPSVCSTVGPMSYKADENGSWPRAGFDDIRGRHPMFRMPNWFSEDDEFSRVNQGPNWSQFGRHPGGSWRERTFSGPSMGEDAPDCYKSEGHTIPIRIEAEAPPGYEQPQEPTPEHAETKMQDGFQPQMKVGNQPAYASKTTSAVDSVKDDVARETRSSSAPPEIENPDKSKEPAPKFNNVAKPFASPKPEAAQKPKEEAAPVGVQSHSEAHPQQTHQQQHNSRGVVRTIPIVVEGRDDYPQEPRSPRRPESHPQQPSNSQRQMPFANVPPEFANEPMFNDPFFEFRGMQRPHPSPHFEQRPQPSPHFEQRPQPQPSPQQKPPQTAQPPDTPKPAQQKPPSPPPKPQETPRDIKMEKIQVVRDSLSEYQAKVNKFEGKERNKEYLYLDEMLTRALLELDNIEPEGRDDIRQKRKTLVKDINATISLLESKLAKPAVDVKSEEKMEVEPSESNIAEKESSSEPPAAETPENNSTANPEKMEVEPIQGNSKPEETAQKKVKTST